MHELDEALELERRPRKAASAPPPTAAGVHAALARSAPVWVPRFVFPSSRSGAPREPLPRFERQLSGHAPFVLPFAYSGLNF